MTKFSIKDLPDLPSPKEPFDPRVCIPDDWKAYNKGRHDVCIKEYEFDVDTITQIIKDLKIVNHGFFAENPSYKIAEAIASQPLRIIRRVGK